MKQFLEITDMPTDKYGTLGTLRKLLVAIFNKCRGNTENMALLKSTLKFVYNKCLEHDKHTADTSEDLQRKQILLEATQLGFDLDERLSTENLAAELSTLKEKKAAESAVLTPKNQDLNTDLKPKKG